MKILFTLLILHTGIFFAQIPVGYYNTAMGLTGSNLKIALHNIIKGHTQISYAGLWNAFQQTDQKANGKVWDIYSYNPTGPQPYEFTFFTNQCGSYSSESDCYNREHSWPQSWFSSESVPSSDLFHIYPTDGEVNGKRSNYPYGNVSSPTWTSMNGGKLGSCTNVGYSSTVLEPIDEFKGDLARGYFYMSTRYYLEDGAWSNSAATSKSDILPWQVKVLLQWHHQDPVSAKEIARNNSIYSNYQHNRNPYIDNPQWADSVWASGITSIKENNELSNSISIYPNPACNSFKIVNTIKTDIQNHVMQVKDYTGKVINEIAISSVSDNSFDCSSWESGIYFITIYNSTSIANFKLVKIN
jgi:endonuclease I